MATQNSLGPVFDPTVGMAAAKAPRVHSAELGGVFDPTVKKTAEAPDPVQPSKAVDIPEITELQNAPMQMTLGMLAANSPMAQVDILRDNYPSMKYRQESIGEGEDADIYHVVDIPEQGEFYLNKPGLSQRDITKPVFQIGSFIAGARAGAGPAKSLIGQGKMARLATGFATGAGTSAALDALAIAAGSKQGVDVGQAAVAGAAGGAGEFAAPYIAKTLKAGWEFMVKRGQPTIKETRALLRQSGIEDIDLPDEMLRQLIKEMESTDDIVGASWKALSKNLPEEIPLTAGKASGDPSMQMAEDMAVKGAFGKPAQLTMQGAEQDATAAIRANVPKMQEQIGGGRVSYVGEGGKEAQAALIAENAAQKKAASALYDVAKGENASFPAAQAETILPRVVKEFEDIIEVNPTVQTLINEIKQLTQPPIRGSYRKFSEVQLSGNVNKLFKLREKINSNLKTASPEQLMQLTKLKKVYDTAITDAVDSGALIGEKEAINAWRTAIKGWRDYKSIFGDNTLAGKMVGKRNGELLIDASDATNTILGRGSVFGRSNGFVRDLRNLKTALNRNTDAWNSIREEAFIKFMSPLEGGATAGERQISGTAMVKFENLFKQNKDAIEVLFTKPEIQQMRNFLKVANRATTAVKGGANFSNTAPAVAKIGQYLTSKSILGGRFTDWLGALPFGGAIKDVLGQGKAVSMASGKLAPKQLTYPAGVAAGLTAPYPRLKEGN